MRRWGFFVATLVLIGAATRLWLSAKPASAPAPLEAEVASLPAGLPRPPVAPTPLTPSPRPPVRGDVSGEAARQDRAKLATLDEVLASKNDNDPRLDLSFRGLSEGTKALFRSRYDSLSREKLNERGTIVFLLGREIKSIEDVSFLERVAREPRCLSLSDCGQSAGADPHLDSVNGVTLDYPKLNALKAMEKWLARADRDPALYPSVVAALRGARSSDSARVAEWAKRILSGLGES